MKVENIATGELVRIPRKLRKRELKRGRTITGAAKRRFDPWWVFITPHNEWFVIRKTREIR